MDDYSGHTQSRKKAYKRGFAALDPNRQREIASAGGIAAHKKGTAHTWNSREAAEAGRKGGRARAENHRNREANDMTDNQTI